MKLHSEVMGTNSGDIFLFSFFNMKWLMPMSIKSISKNKIAIKKSKQIQEFCFGHFKIFQKKNGIFAVIRKSKGIKVRKCKS